jgi:hypothetical protein
MPWSLDYGRPKEPALLDEFFLAAGKALYIANGFEAKLRYVLRMAKLANRIKEGDDLDAWLEYMQTLTDPVLGRALVELTAFSLMKPADIEVLNRARDARNYVAHEGAFVGPLSGASARTIAKRMEDLRHRVAALSTGDNLVSRWVYEIDEKEAAPSEIRRFYPRWVDDWIFGDSIGHDFDMQDLHT